MDILNLFGTSYQGMMLDFVKSVFAWILALVAGILGVDPIQ